MVRDTIDNLQDGLNLIQARTRKLPGTVRYTSGRLVPQYDGPIRLTPVHEDRLARLGWTCVGGVWGYPVENEGGRPSKAKGRQVKGPANDR